LSPQIFFMIINMSEDSIENLKIQLKIKIDLFKKAIAENKPFKEVKVYYSEYQRLEQEIKRREKALIA